MKTSRRNLRYILLWALVILSLSLASCNLSALPMKLASRAQEVATRVVPELLVEVTPDPTPTPWPTSTPVPLQLSALDEEQLLKLLKENNTRFIIIGATASPAHDYCRTTQYIDIFTSIKKETSEINV